MAKQTLDDLGPGLYQQALQEGYGVVQRPTLQNVQSRFQEAPFFEASLTGGLRPPEQFRTTMDLTNKQYVAEKAATTEHGRNLQRFSAQGKMDEARAFMEDEVTSDWSQKLTEPVFDVLSVFNYPMAGAAKEFLRSGSGWNAFKQAASEFANVIPGIDEEDVESWGLPRPQRTTFADVLRETEMFDGEGHGRWSSAVGGLVLDIMTDPFTYTGYGTVVNAVKGLKKYKAISRGVDAVSAVGKDLRKIESVDNSINWLTRSFIPDGEVKLLDKAVVKGEKSFEGLDLGTGIVGALKEGGKGAGAKYRLAKDMARATYEREVISVDELAKNLIANMTEPELYMLGSYLGKPTLFKNQLKAAVDDGIIGKERVGEIEKKFDDFTGAFKKFFDEEEAAGIIDKASWRENYVYGTQATTKRSKLRVEQIRKRGGIPAKEDQFETARLFGQPTTEMFQKERTYDTLLDAIQAGHSRELNAGMNVLRRGFHHARALANKSLIDAVVNNKGIAHRVIDPLTEVQKNTFRAKGYDLFTAKFGKDEMTYLMPKEIVKDLTKAQEVWSKPGEVAELAKAFDWVHGTWKGWAVTSPGFHFRNNFSNWYLNWMGDVGNPEGKYQNVPKVFRSLGRAMTGQESPQAAGMARLHVAALQLQMGGSLDNASMTKRKWLAEKVGAKSLDDVDLKLPEIKGVDGKTMSPQQILDEMQEYGVLNRGWLGADEAEAIERTILQTAEVGKPLKKGEKVEPLFETVVEPVGDGVENLRFMGEGKEIGSMRIVRGAVRDITAESPEKAKQFLADALLKEKAQTIFEEVGGLARTDLEKMGFELLGSDTGKALMQFNKQNKDGLNALTRQFFTEDLGNRRWERMKKYGGPNNPVLDYNRKIGSAVENNARIMHYLDRRIKGWKPEDSANSVKQWLYDYGELTDFERNVMKRVLPFYAWMRNNSVNMVRSVVMNPGRFSRNPKFINAIEELSPEWDNIDTPDYFDELRAIRLPWARSGKPVYLNPNLPFQDINRFNVKDAMASMNPLLKGIFETTPDRGYNIFMDAPIERYAGERSELIPSITKKQEHVLKSALPPIGKLWRLADKMQRGETFEQVATEGAGVKLIPHDTRRHKRGLTFAWRQASRDFKQKLSDE